MKFVVDIDFYIRLLKKSLSFGYSETPLVVNTSRHSGQVTNDSLDKITQLKEFVYLHNKLNKGKIPSQRFLEFMRSLFLKYNVRKLADLKKENLPVPQPQWLYRLLISYLKMKGAYK